MTMITTDSPELAKGKSIRSGWKFVRKVEPALVETWLDAREAFDRHEHGYQARAAAWQRRVGAIRRRPRSEYAEALQEAEAAVRAKFEQLLAAGDVVYGGFPAGQLGGDPVAIPIAALGRRRPATARINVHGVDFYQVKLYPAGVLVDAEPALA